MLRTFAALALGLSLALAAQAEEVPQTPTTHPMYSVQPGEFIVGDANAPVTIIEYSSLTCPHCANFHSNVLPTIKEKYIDTGKAKLVARAFPLNAPALDAAKIVACIDEPERHYKFLEVFFKMQDKWAFSNDYKEKLTQIAAVGGMDKATVDACLADQKIEEAVLTSRKIGAEELTVQSTPTFFINGTKLQGTGSVEVFSGVIEKALAK